MTGRGPGGRGGGKDGRGTGRGGRGGGFAGYGAGQGRGRGDEGGYQRGQQGGYRGGYQGGRGGGGGGPPGGRGGRGGGRGGGPVTVFRDSNEPNPQPDQAITKAENDYIKRQTTTIGDQKLDLAKMNVSDATYPQRPGFGTQGKSVKLLTNYFTLALRGNLKLYRYHLNLVEGRAAGRKLKRLIHLLLLIPQLAAAASDYSSILITTAPLQLPLERDVEYIEEFEDRSRPGIYKFEIREEPDVLDVSDLVGDLQAISFNVDRARRQEIVQGLNIMMGRYPTSSPNIMTVAANRHFPFGDNPDTVDWDLGAGLRALRGYFRSVRLATCRILYNVNVSHAVMYNPIRLDNLINEFRSNNLPTLDKFLSKLRVKTAHLKDESGQTISKTKTIAGLATQNDGQGSPHPPEVRGFGSGPKDVWFYLDSEAEAGPSSGPSKAKSAKPGGPSSKASKGPSPGYISVYDFFKTRHQRTLQNETMPVVNVGTKDKPSYLPPEVCIVIPGQSARKKLNPWQTKNMIDFACRQPFENAASITNHGSKILGLREPANAALVNKGITVIPKLIAVHGRVLGIPNVQYRDKQSITPMGGSWNMQKQQFHTAARIDCWSYLHIRNPGSPPPVNGSLPIQEFHAALRTNGVNPGTVIEPGIRIELDRRRGKEHMEKELGPTFQNFVNHQMKPSVMLIILPEPDTTLYKVIKYLGDVRIGVHTVCVVGSKFCKQQGQYQYFANVALKFNLKAGGTNQAMDDRGLGIIGEGKTMVVGIDVTHPSPDSKAGAPSVAGMVASIDKKLGQWPAILSVQEGRKEMVGDLEKMLKTRLDLWRQKNQMQLPENILVFRDGVSEGQYAAVTDIELPQFRKACREKYPATQTQNGLPRISIVICGKRHHTRFYPTAEQDADRTSNPRNGTVVDRGITEVQNWDFFLQAHACIKGTARPAHYYVVLDEIFRAKYAKKPPFPGGNTADALEELTHNMSHLFGRATRTVSLCPPAYYADLLCERARCYLSGVFDDLSSQGSGGPPYATQMQNDVTIHPRLKDTMFYI